MERVQRHVPHTNPSYESWGLTVPNMTNQPEGVNAGASPVIAGLLHPRYRDRGTREKSRIAGGQTRANHRGSAAALSSKATGKSCRIPTVQIWENWGVLKLV
ncbi:hypothetical protein DM860_015666 [Cuscuta australis]|uniref:Uncharacterized protein n=1 Tax=Cuscuta australis TaxID=267555 RepID=A0A328DFP2_9ASTE|nr:hypothetical protein DM860_015666 [Cuscuta australis]